MRTKRMERLMATACSSFDWGFPADWTDEVRLPLIATGRAHSIFELIDLLDRERARNERLKLRVGELRRERNLWRRWTKKLRRRAPVRGPRVPRELRPYASQMHEVDYDPYPTSCVYFLVHRGKLVYIGRSLNVVARIGGHIAENVKKFDRVFAIPLPEESLDAVESTLIRRLRPPLNGIHCARREDESSIKTFVQHGLPLPDQAASAMGMN